jgi:hypothetical protein
MRIQPRDEPGRDSCPARSQDPGDDDGLRIADRTVAADQYFAVTEKVEALYDQPHTLAGDDEGPEMRKLRAEMHGRMLGDGCWARPVELDCHVESIRKSCSVFVSTIPPRHRRLSRARRGCSHRRENVERTEEAPGMASECRQ